MVFGILLKGFNSLYLNIPIDFCCEFIPQLVFMLCTFGYMNFLMVFKWLNHYEPNEAPSIISTMIDMILTPSKIVNYLVK